MAVQAIAPLTARVAGLELAVGTAGDGPGVIVLHRSTGPLWSAFLDELTRDFHVSAPHMPGYGRSERPAAARHPRDLAVLLARWLDQQSGTPHLVGLGLGGWVAAELAAMAGARLASLTLVTPAGIKPRQGHIADPMMDSFEAYARLGFRDDAHFEAVFGAEPGEDVVDLWDRSREMTARLTWRPWMWSGVLPTLLRDLPTPALVVWGGNDRVVPVDCAEQYRDLLPGARLEVLPAAGHCVELEEPGAVAQLIADHVAAVHG